MRTYVRIAALAASLFCGEARAYGGGGGSASCTEPHFFEPNPTGTVAELSEFRFIASDNTEIDTLTVEIDGQKVQPIVVQRRNGDYEVKAVPAKPFTEAGKVRIALNARSREGCSGFQAHFLDIKP